MKVQLFPAFLAFLLLAACAEQTEGPLGPPPPSGPPITYQGGTGETFSERDFYWSRGSGPGMISGLFALRRDGLRYSCRGQDVILLPETPWSRRRMVILYGSAYSAAVLAEIVRARTPAASSGDYASYARKSSCDGSDHFGFSGLPAGPWYVITLARPVAGPGETLAVMRRIEVRPGMRTLVLN
jgi:hypothetical protein